MNAKSYTVLTVRMPNDLQNVLESIAAEKGEAVSTIVRDMVRQVAADGRRADRVVPEITAGSPVSARNFK
jgi:predicted transcriptional regulator